GAVHVHDIGLVLAKRRHDLSLAAAVPDQLGGQQHLLPERPGLDLVAIAIEADDLVPVFRQGLAFLLDHAVLAARSGRPAAVMDHHDLHASLLCAAGCISSGSLLAGVSSDAASARPSR